MDRGGDINEADPTFLGTPLTNAASSNDNQKIIETLVKLGSKLDDVNDNGQTALDLAKQEENGAAINILQHLSAKGNVK